MEYMHTHKNVCSPLLLSNTNCGESPSIHRNIEKFSITHWILNWYNWSQMRETRFFLTSSMNGSMDPDVSINRMHLFSATVPKMRRLPEIKKINDFPRQRIISLHNEESWTGCFHYQLKIASKRSRKKTVPRTATTNDTSSQTSIPPWAEGRGTLIQQGGRGCMVMHHLGIIITS